MKLLQRNQIYDNRIVQSFGQIGVNKGKMLATTRNSFSRTDHKLPQLNRSYSYSNAKNSKQKLAQLDQRVLQLANKVNDLRLQTRQSRRFTNFLKEDLAQRELNDNKHKILNKLNILDKFSKLTRQNNQERTQLIKNDCQKLRHSSIELQNLMFDISQRVDRLENAMGIYSGKQKHKV